MLKHHRIHFAVGLAASCRAVAELIERFWRHGHRARLRGKGMPETCHAAECRTRSTCISPSWSLHSFSAPQHQAWSMPQGTPHAVSNSMKAAVWLIIL